VDGARLGAAQAQERPHLALPAERSRCGDPHRPEASRGRSSRPVFPGVPLKAPLRLMRKLAGDFEVTVHGSDRSSFSDWAAEEHPGIPEETRKLALGHWLGDKVDQAYRRGDALARRRRLARLWADYCAGREPAEVVDMRGRRLPGAA
jgi:hypothetical protein